ncbi:hypothetical protein GCM10010402_66290 [Actinomadura luteofluorescens]|uniref:hypothetical protein n=1 Tax=Actinomadura luteofluorescens TaxID=46163 RepID=UPI0021647983|nr:hypothetical protein [Actinomadura glauciflava]MCR3744199.1 hypothetical protein [Actinomadura glauciflava]
MGGLITGGASIWAQKVTHRGTYQREREARRDAFQVKRFEIERDALLELQDALAFHIRGILHVDQGLPMSNDIEITRLDLVDTVTKMWLLHTRLLDDEARKLCLQYLKRYRTYADARNAAQANGNELPEDALEPLWEAFRNAQAAIGRSLRQDPFGSERSQVDTT